MVIREAAVDFAEQLDQLAAERAEEFRGDAAGHAVAAVDDDLHRPRQPDVAGDPRQVGWSDVGTAGLAGAVAEPAGVHALPDRLDRFAGQCLAADDHLQPVVVGRIVAAGDRDTALAAQFVRGEVDHRRRHAADIDGIDAGLADAFHQARRQFGSGQAPVAADGDRALAALDRQRTEAVADLADDIGRQRRADDTANVIGLEDRGRQGSIHVRPRAGNN
jgi:hypothetical protein